MSLSLILPTFGGNLENAKRTVESVRNFCNETVIVSTCLFESDREGLEKISSKIVDLPWNAVFTHGFSYIHNAAIPACKNAWAILLGVGETIAQQYKPIIQTTEAANLKQVFLLDHLNDINSWKRIYAVNGGPKWGGLIHEEVGGGEPSGVIARMQDTAKVPHENALANEVLRYVKTVSYNHLYSRLLYDNALLGYTNAGWIGFVNGAKESIEAFCKEHDDLIQCAKDGDKTGFIACVKARMEAKEAAAGVNFNPLGTETSGNETVEMKRHED